MIFFIYLTKIPLFLFEHLKSGGDFLHVIVYIRTMAGQGISIDKPPANKSIGIFPYARLLYRYQDLVGSNPFLLWRAQRLL